MHHEHETGEQLRLRVDLGLNLCGCRGKAVTATASASRATRSGDLLVRLMPHCAPADQPDERGFLQSIPDTVPLILICLFSKSCPVSVGAPTDEIKTSADFRPSEAGFCGVFPLSSQGLKKKSFGTVIMAKIIKM